jgi:hypothetical protein
MVRYPILIVIAGHDPAIYPSSKDSCEARWNARHKPGHDAKTNAVFFGCCASRAARRGVVRR